MTQAKIKLGVSAWLVLAILVVLLWQTGTGGRGVAVGEYDGHQDSFEIAWGNTTNETQVKSLYPLEVRVSNFLVNGSMYVRCRIVPRNSTWLPSNLSREASLAFLPTGDTCLNDAYGQTARATLSTNESVLIPFTLVTPNTVDIWAVSCMTIERCWKTNATDFRSDQKAFLLNITPRALGTLTPLNVSYLCSLDQDCDAYNLFGPQRCLSGRCVDAADLAPAPPPKDDPTGQPAQPTTWANMKQWVRQHQAASTAGIVALLLAGTLLLRRKK